MRKNLRFAALFLMSLFSSMELFAQMDNLTNMSAEWMRTSNRNAALDAADIVVYNPAGLVKLSPGLHIDIGNQTLIRMPKHTFDLGFGEGEQSFKQDKIDPILPNLYASYNKGKWAIFGGIYIPGGGATADYPDGSITTELMSLQVLQAYAAQGADYTKANNQSLKASSYYLAFSLGGAYAINDMFSVSLAARYLSCKNTTKAGMTLAGSASGLMPDAPLKISTEDNADGFGGIIGLNIKPDEKWNIGLHYETAVKLDFKTKVKKDDLGKFTDGAKNRRDLASNLNFGASYKITKKLTAEADYSYYFQKAANWGTSEVPKNDGSYKKWSDMAGDCYTAGAALLYDVNDKLVVSGGTVFTKFLYNDKEGYFTALGAYEAPKNDNWNFSIGGAYKVINMLKVNLALGYCISGNETVKSLSAEQLQLINPNTNPNIKIENKAIFIAVGLDFSL